MASTPPPPRKPGAKPPKQHSSYRHAAKRRNAPTAEMEPSIPDDDKRPRSFKISRREVAGPTLTWDRGGPTAEMSSDPEDDEHRLASQMLYTHEKIDPSWLVDQISRDRGSLHEQLDMLGHFNGLPTGASRFECYQHEGDWQNRLIHGESGMVMSSLIDREKLAGQVQMIYYDPPYGMGYASNFQPAVDDLHKRADGRQVPAGDGLPIKAFRDNYSKGVHSYLDQVHKTATLARELLAETGSLFMQIGDDNVHRCAVILDEVFGAENRVATITWRPTGSARARMLPETASYLLWYARDKQLATYRQIYAESDRQSTMDDFGSYCFVEMADGTTRRPTSEERDDVRRLPAEVRLFKTVSTLSTGYSTTGRSVEYWFGGRWHTTSTTRQWCVSVHAPDTGTRLAPAEGEACPGDPDGKMDVCGMCSLKRQGRLFATKQGSLGWKWYEHERLGRKLGNVWHRQASPSKKRYVVQTAASIVERCMLMTTDPGDLVLDPTCGSGATAEVAEAWGRRWITCDVQRVSVSVARKHLMTRLYPWHRIVGDGTAPSDGFEMDTMPRVSAATLAYDTLEAPENQIALVDRTKVDKKRARVCSPFTVESCSPYRYIPVGAEDLPPGGDRTEDDGQAAAAADNQRAVLDALTRTPVCDADGRVLFRVDAVTEMPPGDQHAWRVTHMAECSESGRDTGFKAAVAVAGPDENVTLDVAHLAANEIMRTPEAGRAGKLLLVGYDFAPNIPAKVAGIDLHRVSADKGLQINETIKGGEDGGTFTVLSDLATELSVVRDDDHQPVMQTVRSVNGEKSERKTLKVELIGWDTYNPGTGAVRQGDDPGDIDCWMIDPNHDGLSFYAKHVYFPNGLRNDAGFRELAKSLGKDLDPEAEDALWGLESVPFPVPDPGRVIAVKVITRTGAEVAGLITEGWQ